MTEHVDADRMHALLDEELSSFERERVEAHVAGCAACASRLGRLREVVDAVRELPAEGLPTRDLWPGIESRIGEARVVPFPTPNDPDDRVGRGSRGRAAREAPSGGGRRVSFSLPQLYAAGIALALLSGGTVWFAMGGAQPQPGASVSVPERPADVRQVRNVEGRYEAAVAELEELLRSSRDLLDPETRRTIRESLETIDRAIAEAEAALERDPASSVLHRILSSHRRTKLRILRQATSGLSHRL